MRKVQAKVVVAPSVSANCGTLEDATVSAQNGVLVPIPTRLEKVLRPLKELESLRSVVEATMIEPPSETDAPLMVTEEFARSELPILVEATSLLFASVVTMELPAMFGVQIVPKVFSVEDAFATLMREKVLDALKRLLPLQVLLLLRSVVEATMMEPPSETDAPLMESDEFWS